MRNSEVVKLVESVNNAVQNELASKEEIVDIARWARMGIDETGSTAYRVIAVLANQLSPMNALENPLSSTTLNMGRAERTIVSEEEETALDTGLDDESQLVEDPLSMGASSYGL